MKVKYNIIKGTAWIGFAQFVNQIERLVFGVVLARLISPKDFGIMAMVATLYGFINIWNLNPLL